MTTTQFGRWKTRCQAAELRLIGYWAPGGLGQQYKQELGRNGMPDGSFVMNIVLRAYEAGMRAGKKAK